jgi:hypothetical protein
LEFVRGIIDNPGASTRVGGRGKNDVVSADDDATISGVVQCFPLSSDEENRNPFIGT